MITMSLLFSLTYNRHSFILPLNNTSTLNVAHRILYINDFSFVAQLLNQTRNFNLPISKQIPRYIICLHEILAHTPHNHVERASLYAAQTKLEELSRVSLAPFTFYLLDSHPVALPLPLVNNKISFAVTCSLR